MTKNTITEDKINQLLDEADLEETVFWGKELVISYRLRSGFTVLGRAACVDPANFSFEIGRKYAREDAVNQLWKLEGYVLQLKLANQVTDLREDS